MRLSLKGAKENRMRYFSKSGVNFKKEFSAKLAHGKNIQLITGRTRKIKNKIDGLITNERGVLLSVTVADCLPIYLFDPVKKNTGILHAGWKGIQAGIIENGINILKNRFGTRPENLSVLIGPHIRKCHFEVGNEVAILFPDSKIKIGKKYFVDLEKEVKNKLTNSRVRSKNISISKKCTYCSKDFFSYRREKPKDIEAMVAYVALL